MSKRNPLDRSGLVLVAGHFSPEVQRSLRIIAADERTTIQALLAEGINAVFAKRGKPEIAASSTTSAKKQQLKAEIERLKLELLKLSAGRESSIEESESAVAVVFPNG